MSELTKEQKEFLDVCVEVLEKRTGKDKDKYHNVCYINNCHHNRDKPKGYGLRKIRDSHNKRGKE